MLHAKNDSYIIFQKPPAYNYIQVMENNQSKSIGIGTEDESHLNFKTTEQRCNIIEEKIKHENYLQVETHKHFNKQFVHNYHITLKGKQIIKVTEIQFENRLVRIVDKFNPLSKNQLNQLKDNNQVKKEHVFDGNLLIETSAYSRKKQRQRSKKHRKKSDDDGEYKFRDIKNVIKNIFRLFQKWVEHNSSSELELPQLLSALIQRHHKYNNQLFLLISEDPLLRDAFIAFCETDGEYSIECSKIVDKQSHLNALKVYLNICLDLKQRPENEQMKPVNSPNQQPLRANSVETVKQPKNESILKNIQSD